MPNYVQSRFKGSIVALVTPFKQGKVDKKALESLVEWHIASGTDAVVAVGTTGESPTLSHSEHQDVVRFVIEVSAGRISVIAGAGSNSTSEAVDLTLFAQKAGANGVLVVAPYYNKPTQEGLFQHYKTIHDASEIPIILYNVPGRTVSDILPETVHRLAGLPRIVGIKDATAKVERISWQRYLTGTEFIQLSGEDATALAANAHGAVGCISVTANVAPALCAEFQNLTLAGDFAGALTIQDRLMPLHQALFIAPNPVPVKYALSLLGRCDDDVRLPLVGLSDNDKKTVADAMRFAGLL